MADEPEGAAAMREGFVPSSTGRIHYVRSGDGEPLVLLHGNGQSSRCWDDVLPALAGAHDVIAWDMPGHGDSDAPAHHLAIEDYADVLLEVLGSLGVVRASVVGSSIGGQIAAAFAARHGDRIDRVVFVDTNFRSQEWWAQAWPIVEQRFAIPVQDMRALGEVLQHPTPARLDRWNIDRCKAGGRQMMSAMWAIREFDMAAALAGIRAPVLLLFGALGPTVDATAAFRAALPGDVAVSVLRESGHFPMHDQPKDFAAAVLAFTGEHASSGW